MGRVSIDYDIIFLRLVIRAVKRAKSKLHSSSENRVHVEEILMSVQSGPMSFTFDSTRRRPLWRNCSSHNLAGERFDL